MLDQHIATIGWCIITGMDTPKPPIEGTRADRFQRLMIFLNGYAASLKFYPRPGTEPGPGDWCRMPDGRAFSQRTEAERAEVRAAVLERVSRITPEQHRARVAQAEKALRKPQE